MATPSTKKIIAIAAPVEITAGAAEGENKGPAKFTSTFYTGGALDIAGYDHPVVIDLAGLTQSKVLVANLDHDQTKRVGNFAVANDGKSLVANGTATAKTAAREEVVESALAGYQWQSSLEVNPKQIEFVKPGKTAEANGQTFEGPAYITRKGELKGFGFVSHGADDNTTATIAASAASKKGLAMDAACKTWIEAMGFGVETLSADQLAGLEANYKGQNAKKPAITASTPFEEHRLEAKRCDEIKALGDKRLKTLKESAGGQLNLKTVDSIEAMVSHAIESGMSVQDFRSDLIETTYLNAHTVYSQPHGSALNSRVLEAALCQAGRLNDIEKHFTDQELQAAHTAFRDGISLNQFFIVAAEANGYRGSTGGKMSLEVQRAAFGMNGQMRQMHGTGFSTIDVANITGAVANKFIHEGWMGVDLTPLRVAAIRPVRNFQQTTTVSLTGALQFEKIGGDGEIKHGTLDEVTYTGQADTYAAMLAITRKDIINDDLGALNAVPRRLGRGGALKLNDIFWTLWMGLEGAGFFAAGNANLNTGPADATQAGLAATEAMFLNQTDYDGKPLGIMPKIILCPTALKFAMESLLDPASKVVSGNTAGQSDVNVFRGRFRLESSPYMSNSAYTGYSPTEWYMLADPNELAAVEIQALNGRVEPQVDTADADFNQLGVQMRGYCDIGVSSQEKKAAVEADGNAS